MIYYFPKCSIKESVKSEHLGGQETPKTKNKSGQLLLCFQSLSEYTNYISPFPDIEESRYFEPLQNPKTYRDISLLNLFQDHLLLFNFDCAIFKFLGFNKIRDFAKLLWLSL